MEIHNLSSKYEISEDVGFLLPDPLEELPEPYHIWIDLAGDITELLKSHRLREEILKLPVLDQTGLSTHRELRLAHLSLVFLAAGYIWQEGDKNVPEVLPECIAVPLWGTSERLGIKPTLGHVDFVLANYKLKDKNGPMSLSNLETIFHFPEGRSSEMFILQTTQCELDFAKGLKHIKSVLHNVSCGNTEGITEDLSGIVDVVRTIKNNITKLHDEVDPKVFYNKLRPFLAGIGGASSPLPDGIIFEGVDDVPKMLIGASAAQSATLQVFDALLGVEHEPDKMSFLSVMREYMLPGHRHFIEDLRKCPSLRKYVQESGNVDLEAAYDNTVKSIVDLRTTHIQLVTRFIVSMSSKTRRDAGYKYDSVAKRGTGGQDLLPFLKSIRSTTITRIFNWNIIPDRFKKQYFGKDRKKWTLSLCFGAITILGVLYITRH